MILTIRDLTPDDIDALAHILVTANDHAFRGLIPDKIVDFPEEESAANWREFLEGEGLPVDDFMLVAEVDGQVVGYTWGGPNDKEAEYGGEIRQLNLLPAYQKRGIGRQLVCVLARRLADRNIHSLRVWTLCVNPNRAFYERLGGVFVREFSPELDGFILSGCIYGWTDTRPLIDSCVDLTS